MWRLPGGTAMCYGHGAERWESREWRGIMAKATLSHGDLVVCDVGRGKYQTGVVLNVLSTGRVLVELGRQGAEHYLRDVRLIDANKVVKA